MTRFLTAAALAALALSAAPSAAQTQPQAQPAQAPQSISKADFVKSVDERFTAVDANKDGSLTKAEIAAAQDRAVKSAEAARDQQFAAEFKKLDTNNDGSLTAAEFKAAAAPIKAGTTADQVLSQLDSNKDGKLSAAEYRAPQISNFDKADTDRNGVLTAQEFAASRDR